MRDDSDRQVITVLDMDTGGDEPLSNHSDNPHFSTIIERRLSRRWADHGKTPQQARDWIAGNDMPNVRRVRQGSRPADLVITG